MVRRVVVAIVIAASALAAQGPQFEVASVKPADTPMGARVNGWDLRAGRLRLINQTLEQIIRTAYAPNMKLFPGLPLERMSGGPDWIRTESFAIVAKAPDGSLLEDGERQMTLMLRELLARRFALRVRIEVRQQPVYSLVIDRSDRRLGRELRPAAAPDGPSNTRGGAGKLVITNMPLHLIARGFEEYVPRPVIYRTGLEGGFDGSLNWSPQPDELRRPGDPAALPQGGPSIFTAVREQLGLRLVAEPGPVEFLVIESVEKPAPD
jgi:uncharacterized protein (TIGR03435 family)